MAAVVFRLRNTRTLISWPFGSRCAVEKNFSKQGV